MEKLKPKLFSVMKTYTKEQFVKDVVAGIIVAIIALPLSIALALASGVGPEQGIYTAIVAGFLISFFGGSPCPDCRTYCSLRYHRGGHCGPAWHGWFGSSHGYGGDHPDRHGTLPHGKSD